MVEWISGWAQGIIVAVIIATIIEMLLPEGSSKKYIKVVVGIYILFTIVSPVITKITNKEFKLSDIIDLDEYIEMKGYKAKNHYLAIKKWVVSAVEQNKIRGGTYGTCGGIAKKNEFTEKNGKLYDSIGNEII